MQNQQHQISHVILPQPRGRSVWCRRLTFAVHCSWPHSQSALGGVDVPSSSIRSTWMFYVPCLAHSSTSSCLPGFVLLFCSFSTFSIFLGILHYSLLPPKPGKLETLSGWDSSLVLSCCTYWHNSSILSKIMWFEVFSTCIKPLQISRVFFEKDQYSYERQ